jgi:predicted ArsR family transcriptional regulator
MSVYPNAPAHRGIDTSIEAADDIAPKLGRLQHQVVTAIQSARENGLTGDEVAARMGVERWSVRPRTSELRRKGVIRDSGRRRPNASGRSAIIWVASMPA